MSGANTRLWKGHRVRARSIFRPVGGRRRLAAVGRGSHFQAHSRLCRFFPVCGLPVNSSTLCSLAPVLKTTKERGKCETRPPTLAESRRLPEPSTACGLWCWFPSQVSSKQVGPRTWSRVPAAEPKALGGIQMVAEDAHHLPGTDGVSGFPGTQVGPASVRNGCLQVRKIS